ncbi:MAG TPA: 50S ribosomal protein L15 [Pirellulales bacterium]
MMIHDVNQGIKKNKKKKRVGRGLGSGHGKTSSRGHKGQGQLAGWAAAGIFQGGTQPLIRRIPKRGFHNRHARSVYAINVGDLDGIFQAGEEVSKETLKAKGIVKFEYEFLKILGDGEVETKLVVKAHQFSASAKAKLEAVGAEVVVLPGPAPVVKNKMKKRQ